MNAFKWASLVLIIAGLVIGFVAWRSLTHTARVLEATADTAKKAKKAAGALNEKVDALYKKATAARKRMAAMLERRAAARERATVNKWFSDTRDKLQALKGLIKVSKQLIAEGGDPLERGLRVIELANVEHECRRLVDEYNSKVVASRSIFKEGAAALEMIPLRFCE
jgi:hypothetical protein